jgi:hypothetical protein
VQIHRVCGYLTVGFGIAVALASAFLSRDGIQTVVGTATVLCAIALPVSYWIYSTPAHMTAAERRARRLDAAMWILRIALALIFIVVGFVKIPGQSIRCGCGSSSVSDSDNGSAISPP